MKTSQCKCGQPATNLVIIKGHSYYLCEKHVQSLGKFLGEKLEPLTKNKVLSETKLTTVQLVNELIRRNLIEFSRFPDRINITKEFIDELKKDDHWKKRLDPKCRECGRFVISGDLCWECSEKLKKETKKYVRI